MDSLVELFKECERIFLENAEELTDGEIEQEDIDGYLAIEGAAEEEISAFEQRFQITLPEDLKAIYRYKNGSGYMELLWPEEDCGYRLLSLEEMAEKKLHFQDEDREMAEFPDVIDSKQLKQLDRRIKPYLFCKRWFPFAEYAGSLYLMLDYNPSEAGQVGQVICYVHDPDFIYYTASSVKELLKQANTVMQELI